MESDGDEDNHESGSIIITGDYEEEYELNEEHKSITVEDGSQVGVPTKSKYYKQTYRPAWEHMPDFKGWLRGVACEPTRAYCIFCQKTLHAHRLSLLKHMCTIRHQKAAQLHGTKKKAQNVTVNQIQNSSYTEGNSSTQEEDESDKQEVASDSLIEYTNMDDEQDAEEVDDEEEHITISGVPIQFQKVHNYTQQYRQPMVSQQNLPSSSKPAISTHVMDTFKGQPVSGLPVSLYKLIEGRWTYINEGNTNPEGKFSNFVDQNDVTPGRYKLHFDVDRYFESRKMDSLYPFIEIVFDCRSPGEQYHIPLLLSPYGYTTYRGN